MKKEPIDRLLFLSPVVGVLGIVKVGVDTVGTDQLLMGAAFGDDAVCDGNDPPRCPNGGQPVGNDQRGPALGQRIKGPLDLGLGDGVQSGGSLVRIRMGGFFRKIRAMATRCFWPPDRSVPRSPT